MCNSKKLNSLVVKNMYNMVLQIFIHASYQAEKIYFIFDVLMEERGLLGGLVDLAIDLKRAYNDFNEVEFQLYQTYASERYVYPTACVANEINLNTCVLFHCM